MSVQIPYTGAQLTTTARKTLAPSSYVSYLPSDYNGGLGFTTPSITATTRTKILIPTTIKSSNDFEVVDRGGGNLAIQYQGSETRTFKVFLSTNISTSVVNTLVEIYMYRNDVEEPGTGIDVKISTGGDQEVLPSVGEFTAGPNDFLEIYLETDNTCTATFKRTSIIFTEKN